MTNTEQIAAMAERIEKLEGAAKEMLAADDAMFAFMLGGSPPKIGAAERDRQHALRSERRRKAVYALRALLSSGGMRVNDLEPCPFCGGTDIDPEELGYNGLGHHVCRDCHASGPTAEKTHANSAKAWNKRALLSSGDQG